MTHPPSRERNLLLSQIWELFKEHGADLSMEEIANALHINAETFYAMFEHRTAMFIEACDWQDSQFDMDDSIRAAMGTQANAVDMFYKTMEVWYPIIPSIYPVASELIRLKSMDPDIDQAWQSRQKTHWATVHYLAQTLRRQDELKDMWDVEVAADYLWVHSSIQTWALYVHDRGWTPEAAQTGITNTMAFALLKNPRPLYKIEKSKSKPSSKIKAKPKT